MTAPVWMASPPEVHSVLLSSGPGPAPTLSAVAAWQSLSMEYLEAADEAARVLAGVQAGSWAGTGAESYMAAHAPYVAWLLAAGAASAATSVQLDVAAAAYVTALAAMPSLPELAANHVAHEMMLATNFFGINTIPIALNEADYVRMWVQAALTMSAYHAASAAALAATPQLDPAPRILKSSAVQRFSTTSRQSAGQSANPLQGLLDQLEPILKSLGITDSQVAHDPMISNDLTTFVAQILQNVGVNWNPGAGTLDGQVYDYYADAGQSIWYLARSLELFEDFLNISQNPGQAVQALQYLAALTLFDFPTHIAQLASTVSQSPALLAVAAGAALAPAGAAGGLAGLAGLADLPHPQLVLPAAPVASGTWPSSATVAPLSAPASAPTSTPAPAPAASTAATGPAPPPPPPSAGATGWSVPYAVGPPGIGFGSGVGIGASASDKRRAPEPDAVAASAAARAAEQSQRRARRRQRKVTREFGDEFVTATNEPPVESVAEASNRGSGALGFAGTAAKPAAAVTGLTVRESDSLGSGPVLPLLPASWPSEVD